MFKLVPRMSLLSLLLATLVDGLRFLSAHPLNYSALRHSQPFRDIQVAPLKAKEEINRTYLKTEASDKRVVKFFDSKDSIGLVILGDIEKLIAYLRGKQQDGDLGTI